MRPLKVIQIIDSLNVGGTEVLAVNLANSYLDFNISSHLCTTRKEGFLKEKLEANVGYIHLSRKTTLDITSLLKLKKYIKSNNISIVHAHSTSLFFACCLKVINPKLKLFWHNHTGANINLKGGKYFLIKILTTYVDGIINVNEELRLWSKNKLNHKNCIKLNNFPLFTDNSRKTKLKGENHKRIVCVAALRPEKDHLNLLEAFKIINKNFPKWTLHLVGKDYYNDYSIKIKNYIFKNELKKSVFLYGMCSDIKYVLEQSTIGVLSSENEGLPISLLEYGLAKLPVLATDVGECKDVINNTNAIVLPKNSTLFSESLSKLIKSEELREEISTGLYNNVNLNFSKKKFISRIKRFYLSV